MTTYPYGTVSGNPGAFRFYDRGQTIQAMRRSAGTSYKVVKNVPVPASEPKARFEVTEDRYDSSLLYVSDTSRSGGGKNGKYIIDQALSTRHGFTKEQLTAAAKSMSEAVDVSPVLYTVRDRDGDLTGNGVGYATKAEAQAVLDDVTRTGHYKPYSLEAWALVKDDEKDPDRYDVDVYAGNWWIVDTRKTGRSEKKFHPVTTFEGLSRVDLAKIAKAASAL